MSDIQLKDVLARGCSFCVLPFLHHYQDINNTRSVCCTSDIPVTPERLVGIQQDMLAGLPVPECTVCLEQEQRKTVSHRQQHNREWFRRYPELVQSVIEEPKTYSYDLRYSNLCNLRCQTCGPKASSAWAHYLLEEDVDPAVRALYSQPTSKHLGWDPDMQDIQPDARKIYFAGGEPFLIKSFSRVLDRVENTDCEIVVNTNATILTEHLLTALERFNNVCFQLSIDGTGEVIERIRTLCSWDQICTNIETLRTRLNPSFSVNTVVQRDNVANIPELACWIDSQDITLWDVYLLEEGDPFSYTLYDGALRWDSVWHRTCLKSNPRTASKLRRVESILSP